MLETINTYAGLINLALSGTIIGFLIHISRMSRTAIKDKYEAKTEALEQRIALLETQESVTNKNHEAAINLLEKQLQFYQSIADMPDDQKVAQIKSEYQQKLSILESELRTKVSSEAELRQQLAGLEEEAETVSNAPSPTTKEAMKVLQNVVETLVRFYI